MLRKLLLLVLLLPSLAFAQRLHVTLFGGAANYMGDIVDKPFAQTQPAGGFGLLYEISDRAYIRAGFVTGKLVGYDQFSNNKSVRSRNLNFQTTIAEGHLMGQFHIINNPYEKKISLYLFAGLGVFGFDPYTKDAFNNKVFLQPLGTEGQGTAKYPDRPLYNRTGLAIPFGGGIQYSLSENVKVHIETGLRKLFTDYLDDISTTYADEAALLAGQGPVAVELAYRGDELPGADPNFYPAEGELRGNPKSKDWYYFSGIGLSFRLGKGGGGFGGGKGKGLGCPRNVW
jgi:Domain of unknown function (DUF6089)